MQRKIIDDVNYRIYRCLADHEILKRDNSLQEMMFYALGFDKNGGLLSGGKRLRPLFCCLCCGLTSGTY